MQTAFSVKVVEFDIAVFLGSGLLISAEQKPEIHNFRKLNFLHFSMNKK